MDPEQEISAENKGVKSVSQRKIDANRQNAQKSTGPKTSEGKAKTCLNAQKHGLTAELLMCAADGTPLNPEAKELDDCLHDRYGLSETTLPEALPEALPLA